MEFSDHSNLYGEQRIIPAAGAGLFRIVMQAFEVLNRQRWSAPWEVERRGPACRR